MVFRGRIAGSLLLSLMLPACAARLSATVDVIDPSYIQGVQEEYLTNVLLKDFEFGGRAVVDSDVARVCGAYRSGVKAIKEEQATIYENIATCFDEGENKACSKDAKQVADAVRAGAAADETDAILKSQLEKFANRVRNNEPECDRADNGMDALPVDSNELLAQYKRVVCEPPNDETETSCDPQKARLEARRYSDLLRRMELSAVASIQEEAVLSFVPKLSEEQAGAAESAIGELVNQSAIPKEVFAASIQIAESESIDRGYLGADGVTLVRSYLAYAAESAPEDVWEQGYNIAEGIGVGGSTDVVIRLNSTADFSVKGLVFDARSTALAAQKLTISSLQLLAAGTGLPIKAPSSENSPNETLIVENQLSEAKAQLDAENARQSAYRGTLRTIATQVLSAGEMIEKGSELDGGTSEAERLDARKRAYGAFKASSALLKPPVSAPSGGE